MARLPKLTRSSLAALLFAVVASAAQLPSGAEIPIRLKTKVSTQTSKAGDPVEAVVIGGPLAGAAVRGTVEKVVQSTKSDERSALALKFQELEKAKIEAKVAAVENARETVTDDGTIQGILAGDTITGKLDSGINRISTHNSGLAGVLGTIKNTVFKAAESDISYDSGVELTLKLTNSVDISPPERPKLEPFPDPAALEKRIAAEAFQTVAENPPKPSDITNLVIIGTEEQVRRAFSEAGWHTAAELNTASKLETLRAVAENRGYSEAPVSVLLLEGKPPDMVFQKVTNTFSRRHHLRVWRRGTYDGRPLWSVAATHDIGITFSEQNRTFIHQIDSQIDRERTKVVDDLVFTGLVQSSALIDRPQVPKKAENATGDALETDAKIAVLLLR